MRVQPSDERDSTWESHRPRFRVYFFRGGEESGSWAVETFDVEGADVVDVVRWAQDEIGDGGLYAVALVAGGGLTWLVGMDANDTPVDDDERARLAAMAARRGKRVVNP